MVLRKLKNLGVILVISPGRSINSRQPLTGLRWSVFIAVIVFIVTKQTNPKTVKFSYRGYLTKKWKYFRSRILR